MMIDRKAKDIKEKLDRVEAIYKRTESEIIKRHLEQGHLKDVRDVYDDETNRYVMQKLTLPEDMTDAYELFYVYHPPGVQKYQYGDAFPQFVYLLQGDLEDRHSGERLKIYKEFKIEEPYEAGFHTYMGARLLVLVKKER